MYTREFIEKSIYRRTPTLELYNLDNCFAYGFLYIIPLVCCFKFSLFSRAFFLCFDSIPVLFISFVGAAVVKFVCTVSEDKLSGIYWYGALPLCHFDSPQQSLICRPEHFSRVNIFLIKTKLVGGNIKNKEDINVQFYGRRSSPQHTCFLLLLPFGPVCFISLYLSYLTE